ncbi:MAG: hypothetical protein U0350_03650 [Caldilineaceae bacterium]
MEAIRLQKIVQEDGELYLPNLPVVKGQQVEVVVLMRSLTPKTKRQCMTARQLLNSGLIGLWKNRTDITDSSSYARQLREQAQRRSGISNAE